LLLKKEKGLYARLPPAVGPPATIVDINPTRWEDEVCSHSIVRGPGSEFRNLLTSLLDRTAALTVLDGYALTQNARPAWKLLGETIGQSEPDRALLVRVFCTDPALTSWRDPMTPQEALDILAKAASREVGIEFEMRHDTAFMNRGHDRFLLLARSDSGYRIPDCQPRWFFWLGKGLQSLLDGETTIGILEPSNAPTVIRFDDRPSRRWSGIGPGAEGSAKSEDRSSGPMSGR